MNEIKIIGKINELLYTATDLCCGWLNKMLPRISDNWWTNCVLDSLSFNQNQLAQEKGYKAQSFHYIQCRCGKALC